MTAPSTDNPSPTPAAGSTLPTANSPLGAGAAAQPQLSLWKFLDVAHLLTMQEKFSQATHLRMTILDHDGSPLNMRNAQQQEPIDDPQPSVMTRSVNDHGCEQYTAPIYFDDQQLGTVVIESCNQAPAGGTLQQSVFKAAVELGVDEAAAEKLADRAAALSDPNRDAAIEFLNLWADSITQLCYRGHRLRQRVDELSALYTVSTTLAAHRDLQQVLDTAARTVAEVMSVKSSSIRLLDDEGRELVPRASFNLSSGYLHKGPVMVKDSELDQRVLGGEVIIVRDMTQDHRVRYREFAKIEGLVSMLTAPMIYKGRPIGLMRLYTDKQHWFTPDEKQLLLAVAQLVASAIETARLDAAEHESLRIQHQLHMAADVQRRMMPASSPHLPPFDIAARYVPSFELGGDFYDYIPLEGHLGIVVGDVVGKGVAASLLMASVRAALRAYAQDVFDLDEIISRVNVTMSRETLDNEFATLFYCVLDPSNLRMTYCNAGHEPPLLLRDGHVTRLESGGMIVGVDPGQTYLKQVMTLRKGDLLLIHSDGLSDAMNFAGDRFGRKRVIQAMHDVADANANDAMNHILWQMRRYVGVNRLVDDTTLVVLKVQ